MLKIRMFALIWTCLVMITHYGPLGADIPVSVSRLCGQFALWHGCFTVFCECLAYGGHFTLFCFVSFSPRNFLVIVWLTFLQERTVPSNRAPGPEPLFSVSSIWNLMPLKHTAYIGAVLHILYMHAHKRRQRKRKTAVDICFKNSLQPVGVKHLWVKGCRFGSTV